MKETQKTLLSSFVVLMINLVIAPQALAQFIEDALRVGQPPTVVSARSLAMGNAFVGFANDYSALFWNPAGLGQLRNSEFSVGLFSTSNKNTATFLGNRTDYENSATSLNSIGLALPFPVARGSFVLAAGYNRLLDYNNSLAFSGYNRSSSIQPLLFDRDIKYDLAWQVGLEDTLLFIPITKDVQQDGKVFENGSLGQWAFGGSAEVAPNLLLGITFNILSGSYRWSREFIETDPLLIHQGVIAGIEYDRDGFQKLTIDEIISQDFSGWDAKFGVLYTYKDKATFGMTIKTPSMITIKEEFSKEGTANFSGSLGYSRNFYALPVISNDYDINTSWVFGFGASVKPMSFFAINADVDLTDFSSFEFADASESINPLHQLFENNNREIKQKLRSTTNYRFGTEIHIPSTSLYVRGGFGYYFSPFTDDPSSFDTKILSAGLGYVFNDVFLVNATFARSSYRAFHYNYQDLTVPESSLRTDESTANTYLLFSFLYRF